MNSDNKYRDRKLIVSDMMVSYASESSETKICKGLDLEFKSGEIVGILGPNGSGKSTLTKALLEQVTLQKGNIDFSGFNVRRPKLSTIPQNYRSSFFQWTSLNKNIHLAAGGFFKLDPTLNELIQDYKERLGIKFDLGIKPRECSGGMLQQAAILRALALRRDVLIADEPFSALDINVSEHIRPVFREMILESKSICIIVLHSLDEILSICDKLIVIPNKPYTTNGDLDEEGYHKLVEFTNPRIEENTVELDSLVDLASKIFNEI